LLGKKVFGDTQRERHLSYAGPIKRSPRRPFVPKGEMGGKLLHLKKEGRPYPHLKCAGKEGGVRAYCKGGEARHPLQKEEERTWSGKKERSHVCKGGLFTVLRGGEDYRWIRRG